MTTAELAQNQISLKIAEKMSEIHSLNIPVSKEPEWLFLTLNRWLNSVDTIFNDIRNNNNEKNTKNFSNELSKIDFRAEVNWLKNVIESAAYPVVFCHNDLQEGNILLRQRDFTPLEKTDDQLSDPLKISIGTKPHESPIIDNSLDSDFIDSTQPNRVHDEKPELMIIDFEYCAYNYRAFDIANHFLGEFDFIEVNDTSNHNLFHFHIFH